MEKEALLSPKRAGIRNIREDDQGDAASVVKPWKDGQKEMSTHQIE